MRVLHFFKTYWPDTFGGVERTIYAIAKGTAKYGVESDVLSLSKTPLEHSVEFDGHMALKAKLDFEFASTGFSREVFGRFRELSRQADIVHYHFPWPLMDIIHFIAPPSKPTVVTYHSDIVKQKFLLQFYKPLMFRFLKDVDRIVATSPNYAMSSDVLERFKSKTRVISLGLDEADYPKADEASLARWRGRLPDRFLLFVGVLRYYKGVHILLEAAKYNGLDIVIVGSGPMEVELKQAAGQNLHNIHFLGSLSDNDKIALLELCAGFVFPSHLRSEAFGLSLVEAAMFGKPMISCEIGTGTSYVNLDRVTGFVVPPNDVDALSGAMKAIWDNEQQTAVLGAAARDRYLACFTAEKMCSQYYRLYRELAG
ncbi:glycosyltransferase family 4 protein [Rhizobium sp. AB2/73]|uniref:glycosyltransferase family 4 protein n=1 Tax=Rhizobium sp. AB2/73 TaxID=2795216 RepID=UPI001C5F1481|nr:glycosyltransferase family 4 protein [Rhizobium sp. AB2/73]QYA13689.1 glycosyltransferase family 4 protein [Rhizobium sp. AB2/73]UEQ80381.1 glycosyltransferase family 4 protein [Rhizobium sp. AB2/73]